MRLALLKGFKIWFAAVGLVAFAGSSPLYAQQAVSPVAPLAAPRLLSRRSRFQLLPNRTNTGSAPRI